ncbi:MAG: GTPase ObgE [Planctomycetes bacterium]|nr:GTPase ObgE [Planctomycetota bacterium]
MFKDEHTICVRGGKGGDGIVAFRREKFVPKGGPAGGDGGDGGSVLLRASHQLATFSDMPDQIHFRAENGASGEGSNRTGATGEDLEVEVPVGTIVRERGTGLLLRDLDAPDATVVVAQGGKGGFGNAHFKNSQNQAPRIRTKGAPGEERWLSLELKLLADAGLVGLPNAGKSTLLSRLTRARPKIAAYPFTTLTPYLGIVSAPGYRSFTLADLPGLIEGASRGHGLGHEFLRHIERTRVLVHVVDLFGGDPAGAYRQVRAELLAYGHGLAERPEIVVANKIDIGPPGELLKELSAAVDREVVPVSGVSGDGLPRLVQAIVERL